MEGFLTDFLNSLTGSSHDSIYDMLINGNAIIALWIESTLPALSDIFQTMYAISFSLGVSLIVLKFLKKGFDVYILWTDGDAEADPISLLTNFTRAIAVAICFPTLYEWMAKIVLELVNKITESIEIGQVNVMPGGLFDLILNLVINILLVLIYFQFVKRGMEVFILRLGMPIACVGLIESDQGSFKPYLQEFFQSMFAIIVQLFLVKLVFVVLQTGDIQAIMLAIPICMTALSTPKFLAKFVSSTGGGGGLNAIYQGSRMLQMAKGLARR